MQKKVGGKREGAGRKSIAAELNTRQMAISALIKKFGSIDNAWQYMLSSGETQLIKFVIEHAFGKPQDKVEHSGEMTIATVTGMKIV